MESPIEKPFKCSTCFQSFTNEDHLQVHRKRHEMSLSLGLSSSSGTDPPAPEGFTDETPTPTRFFRISEEVGFFQDIQNVNPFDEQFTRATSSGTSKEQGSFAMSLSSFCSTDTLNTPQVLGFSASSTPLPLPHVQNQASEPPLGSNATLPNLSTPVKLSKKLNDPKIYNSNVSNSSPSSSQRTELLERNRAAAVRSRERRRQWISELELKNKQLLTLLGQVHSELKRIRQENVNLKEELNLHSNCNVSLEIQKTKSVTTINSSSIPAPLVPTIRCDLPTILPKSTDHEYSAQPMVHFVKPNQTTCKRGRPRKGYEKKASFLLPRPIPAQLNPPLKVQILPLHRSINHKYPQATSPPSVIVFQRGTAT